MPYPLFWTIDKIEQLKSLYNSGLSMKEVGEKLEKSVWSINSLMKRKNIPRRLASSTRRSQFLNSSRSFTPKLTLNNSEKTLKTAGLMLYWAEGGKKNISGIDFANSDPEMIKLFVKFLREIYQVNESRFRVYLYSYQSLPTQQLIEYWSTITQIPTTQFTKPYIRQKSKMIHDKMQHGLIHIRYSDLRLFKLIMSEIKQFYC